jgi:hypothetical protein
VDLELVETRTFSSTVVYLRHRVARAPPGRAYLWSRDGNICIGEALKSAVRLTFPKGALLPDPDHLFNTRLDSATMRAVDVREDDRVNEAALRALIVQAVALNTSKTRTR